MSRLSIDIWSDIACPWCYVGKRRLEAALSDFEHADAVDITWHAFELDPSLPRELPPEPSYAERLARKYRTSLAGAEGMIDRMTGVAKEEGLDFRFDRIRPGNSFDAHRLIRFAKEHGLQGEMKERLLAAYLCEGDPIGDRAALVKHAVAVGLDEAEVTEMLEGETFAEEVRADEQQARESGITGVPFFVLDGRFAVSGAQPSETLRLVLKQVWDKIAEADEGASPTGDVREGAACGPDGLC